MGRLEDLVKSSWNLCKSKVKEYALVTTLGLTALGFGGCGDSGGSDEANPPFEPTFSSSPSSFDFGASSTTKMLNISNTGAETLTWSITDNKTWLSTSPLSGSTTTEMDTVTVAVDRLGLSSGNYSGTLTLTHNGSNTSPRYIPVDMEVGAPSICYKIVFASDNDGDFEIYSMDENGSNKVRLTNNITNDYEPTWSPDGSKIAFISERTGNSEIYLMNKDGTNQINLTNNPAEDYYNSYGRVIWSPDGSKIVFTSDRDGKEEIYTMGALVGDSQTRLTSNPESWEFNRRPSWYPSGLKISFESYRDLNTEIYIMNSDGSGETNLTNNPDPDFSYTLSPDGTKIAFTSDRDGNSEIYLMNPDGTNQINLTNNFAWDGYPAWSPDGSKISFTSERDDPDGDIYIMNASGSGVTRLVTDPNLNEGSFWSPDGSKIIFGTYKGGNILELYIMNADGSGQTNLTNNSSWNHGPMWSPNKQ